MQTRAQSCDMESGYKETFRVFSKDDDGCIPAAEIRYNTVTTIFPSAHVVGITYIIGSQL